jgi:hypothetical protein
VQNEIFKRLWLCFTIYISKINASKIFFSSETLELKLEPLWLQKSWKQKVTSYFYQGKNLHQNLRFNLHETLSIWVAWIFQIKFALNLHRKVFAFGNNFETPKNFLWYRSFVRTKHFLWNIILEKTQANTKI